MRIGFVTDNHPRLGQAGGIGTYTDLVSNRLADLGHEVHVWSFGQEQSSGPVRLHALEPWHGRRQMGLRRALRFTWDHFNDARRLNSFQIEQAIRSTVKDVGPFDMIEAPEFAGLGQWIVGERRYAKRVAVRLHGSRMMIAEGWRPSPDDPELLTIDGADVLTAPTTAAAAWTRRTFERTWPDIRVVGNPVRWMPRRRGPRDGPGVFSFGRLEYRKGTDRLAHALALLGEPAVLAGADLPWSDGEPASRMMRAVGATVEVLGRLPHREVLDLASRSRAVVLLSRQETFGLTLLEAMMAGTPVVAADIPAFAELSRGGAVARLVPGDDPAMVASALRALLDDPEDAESLADDAYAHSQAWRVEPIVDQLLAAWTG